MEMYEKELETSVQTQTETKQVTETRLEDLPRLEDFLKSEKEIRTAPELTGLKQVEQNNLAEEKVFTRKADEKKAIYQKRAKIVTGVYISVVAMLFGFVLFNIFTLVALNKQTTNNTMTIQSEQSKIEVYEENPIDIPNTDQEVLIKLNEPRDYSDDAKELSFLDKVTILFKNIFG